ncbi:MAG: TrkH family potassium uptake protein [Prolixibacteraceae bacterium]|nr:TrkH family potassium uptake protein [Prolixibacteraceae bacterium]MBN2650534.1 TrkH family potassium uptake protein [Prolixibacteraceae bacterium]
MRGLINFQIISRIISTNLFIVSGALASCVIISIVYKESYMPFALSSFIGFGMGLLFLFYSKYKKRDSITLNRKDAYLTVTLSWILLGLLGSLPYIFSGTIPSFINALFESISGFTTTGSSILTDIECLPKSILFWRSFTHWIGGIGIIVLVIIVMPTLQIGGYHLFTLESSLQDKIQPRIKSVGNRLLLIYLGLTALEIIFLLFGGMNLFESTCHAFGTIATGGFSPKNTSIGGYPAYIQYVIMLFMFLSGSNFIIHYYIVKRKLKKVRKNEEFKFYVLVVLVIGLIITSILFFKMHKPLEEAFRESFFQVISIVTCTGYATADYLLWPTIAWVIIFFAMFLGGSTGSTAGGIKIVRHLIVFKNLSRIIKKTISIHAVIPIRLNKNSLTEESNASILSFIAVYFVVFLSGSMLLILLGIDGKTASSSVATCMAGIGPGIGSVGPASNFAHLPDVAKVILSFLMLVGRLEIYTVLALFSKSFWRK